MHRKYVHLFPYVWMQINIHIRIYKDKYIDTEIYVHTYMYRH
jgi:hypothetical protein